MPTDHSSTIQSYLQQNNYRNVVKAKQDILNCLQCYAGLHPKVETFTFNDGTQRQLLVLDGTIPVPYRGQKYNIPVALFLLGLVQVCIIIFGEQPPVFAKPRNAPPVPPQPTQTQPPYPPQPQQGGYPPYPPNPTSSYGSQPPYPPNPSGGMPPPYPGNPSANGGPPAYPPAYPPNNSYQPPYPPTSNNTPYPPVSVGSSYQQQSVSTNTAGNPVNNSGTITEEHIRASLLSAVEDKIRRAMREEFQIRQDEMESLKRIRDELTSGQNQLKAALARMEHEEMELDKSLVVLREKKVEIEKMTEKLEETKELDPDEAVVTTTPLYRQLLDAFAEEAAIEDAIYYLGEALRRGAIDSDVFLKYVRNLSRKQFMLRATMQRCRQKAGLSI